jgi:outer membrane protein TolC
MDRLNGAIEPTFRRVPHARRHPLGSFSFAFALSLVALSPPAVQATDPLALEDCIALALSNNLGHLSDRQTLESSRARYQQAHSPFAIDANLELTAPSYVETQDTFEDAALVKRFQEENTTFRYETRLNLSRRVDRVGQFSMRSTGFRHDFDSNRRDNFLEYFGDIDLQYQRDLLSTPTDEIGLRQAELDLTINSSTLERRELLLEQHVANTYFDLARSLRQLEIQQQRLQQASAALILAQKKYEIGLIAEVEALRLQVEKLNAEATFAQAETEIERRRDILRDVLGIDQSSPLEIDTDVQADRLTIDEERAVSLGLENRSDITEAELREQINELDLKRRKDQTELNASLVAGVTLRGRGPEPGDVSDSFERSRVMASLQIGLPVVDSGWRRGLVRQGEAALEQSRLSRQMQRRQVILDIRDAVRNVREAERQIDLRQASLEVTERQYEVEQARFELGIGDSQELLDAQTTLTSARTEALESVINYRRSLQSLRIATMSELSELEAGTPPR